MNQVNGKCCLSGFLTFKSHVYQVRKRRNVHIINGTFEPDGINKCYSTIVSDRITSIKTKNSAGLNTDVLGT